MRTAFDLAEKSSHHIIRTNRLPLFLDLEDLSMQSARIPVFSAQETSME